MEKTSNFTEGKIFSTLLKFSLPMLAALLLQAMYGAADLIIVGKFGDATGVSAVATGSQIMQTITGFITGLCTGTMICIGQFIGANKSKEAGDTVGVAIIIFSIVAVCITVIMMMLVKPFVTLMKAPAEAYDKTVQYVFICASGTIFITAYNTISSILRGIGNSILPLVFVGIACVVNIVGDLFFVAVLGMDATGAALATVLAQGVSVILSIVVLRKKRLPFVFNRKNIRFDLKLCKRILKMGGPVALQDAMTSISFLILTSIVNSLGLVASAGVGIAEKVCVFIMLIPMAYMSSISAFVAQNVGANKYDRARTTVFCGMGSSLIFGISMFVLAFFHGDLLAGFFSTETTVIMQAALYLKAYAVDCILVCFLFCMMGFFNGCGKTTFVMVQSVLAAFLIRIPFAYFMSQIDGTTLFHIGLASPIATFFSVMLCLIYLKSGKWKNS